MDDNISRCDGIAVAGSVSCTEGTFAVCIVGIAGTSEATS